MNPIHDRQGHLAGLITAAAGGNHTAFRELHALTYDYLYHTALRLLRLPSLAEDVLQDAYLSIWLHAKSFRPGQASPMTWLIAIVRNRAFSILRSKRNSITVLMSEEDPALLAEMEQGDDADPGAQVFDALARMRLAQAMARLEPAQRQSIALAFGQELTHAEIARHLGVPLGTAKSWLRRGLERLRVCMEETGDVQPIMLSAMRRRAPIELGPAPRRRGVKARPVEERCGGDLRRPARPTLAGCLP